MSPSVKRIRWTTLVALGAITACDSISPAPPLVCSSSTAQQVNLALGAFQSIAPPPARGCVTFPANGPADSAKYLVVAQIATDSQGASTSFTLDGDSIHAALGAQVAGATPSGSLPLGVQFHDFLRTQERTQWAALPPVPPVTGAAPTTVRVQPPPVVGDVKSFSVCSNLTCSVFVTVTATAKTVTGHLAIFVDNTAPAAGLTQGDLDALGALFDSKLYAIDTTAFGRESDIDANTVVTVLMTNTVNKLVTKQQCKDQGFVAGFFLGADIDPRFRNDSRVNHGEVFYSMVADPDSTLSCAHDVNQVKRIVPVTFVHEFQHMISFNQHVLIRSGQPQAVWLDEGMSHFAEELGGRSFLPADPVSFSNFVIGDLLNAYQFMDSSGSHFLVFSSGIGSLAERGAVWLFVRYLTDQFRADTSFAATATFTRSLVQTTLLGGQDVAAQTGTPFATLVARWSLANYVSDLPGFSAPATLKYTSWAFRTTYDSLHVQRPTLFPKPFPLTPVLSAGPQVNLTGTLKASSGVYAIAHQAPSAAGFTLLYLGASGLGIPAALIPRLNVVRIR